MVRARTTCKVCHPVDSGVGEQAFGEWSMRLIIEPGGDGAPLAVGEADVDRRE
jgi:hypothetical protein